MLQNLGYFDELTARLLADFLGGSVRAPLIGDNVRAAPLINAGGALGVASSGATESVSTSVEFKIPV